MYHVYSHIYCVTSIYFCVYIVLRCFNLFCNQPDIQTSNGDSRAKIRERTALWHCHTYAKDLALSYNCCRTIADHGLLIGLLAHTRSLRLPDVVNSDRFEITAELFDLLIVSRAETAHFG
jgi:hypothetical protein